MTHRFPFINLTLAHTQVTVRSHLFTFFSHQPLASVALTDTQTHINWLTLPSPFLPLGRDFPLLKMKGGKGGESSEEGKKSHGRNRLRERIVWLPPPPPYTPFPIHHFWLSPNLQGVLPCLCSPGPGTSQWGRATDGASLSSNHLLPHATTHPPSPSSALPSY